MPKIVIREFDKTTAVGPAYANFSVVVPGKANDDADCFDYNGVYECNSRTEFKKKIGLHGSNMDAVPAVAPTLESVAEGETPWPKALTEDEFDTLVVNGNLYRAEDSTENIGKYRDGSYEYTRASAESKYEYNFIPAATEGEEPVTSEEELTLFAVLTNEGADAIPGVHYGNQIAWELLGLGYTVLYKKIEKINDLKEATWWAPLKDKSMYDFRYIISGLAGNTQYINNCMIDLAEFDPETKDFDGVNVLEDGRGDCVALLDINPTAYKGKSQATAITDITNEVYSNVAPSKYAAVFAPTVTYAIVDNEDEYNKNKTFPASFHYLACAARSAENYNEWYANAGYTRGVSKYTVESVGCKFGEAAVNAFQRRSSDLSNNIKIAVNPIISLRGNTYLWGNRTAAELGDPNTADGDLKASHFLNIRQLCTSIKKQVYMACRQFTFDPNSETLWTNFCNTIRPLLEKMKADQGIEDYKFVKTKTDRKAFLSATIRIVPIEAVEDFDISIYLEDSLGGTAVNVEE